MYNLVAQQKNILPSVPVGNRTLTPIGNQTVPPLGIGLVTLLRKATHILSNVTLACFLYNISQFPIG